MLIPYPKEIRPMKKKKMTNFNNMMAKCVLFKLFSSSVRFLTQRNKQLSMTHAKAIGVVMLIMMFSFGFMFNPDKIIDESELNKNIVLKSFGNIFEIESNVKSTRVDHMATIISGDEGLENVDKKRVTKMKSRNTDDKKITKPKSKEEVKKTDPMDSDQKVVKVKVEEETESMLNYTQIQKPDLSIILPDIKEWKPNTTYLLCNNVKQLTPPVPLPQDLTSPMILSLFIPPDPEEICLPGEKSMLEVTCKVIDLQVSRLPLE